MPRTQSSQVKRCAIYTSALAGSIQPEETSGLETQRRACIVHALRQPGWEVLSARYEDAGSAGRQDERPGLHRLLRDVQAGQVDVVLVDALQSLGCSVPDFLELMQTFETAGVSFVSVAQNFSSHDYLGRFTLNCLDTLDKVQRDARRSRARCRLAEARRRGRWTGGPVPLGYKLVDHRLVVNELEAVLVREIFAVFLEQRSTLDVAHLLNDRHRETKRHHAKSGRIREAHSWKTSDVLRILRNPTPAGYVTIAGERHAGRHEPIIEPVTFDAVQEILDSSSGPRRGRQATPEYLLRGLLFCGACGAVYTTASTKTRGRLYRYYRCSTREQHGTGSCGAAPLPAAKMEATALAWVCAVVASPSLPSDVAAAITARIDERRTTLLIECRELPLRIEILSNDIREIGARSATCVAIDWTAHQERLSNLEQQLARAKAQLSAAETSLTQLEGAILHEEWVAHCLIDFKEVWHRMNVTSRRRLMRAVTKRVEILPNGTTAEVTLVNERIFVCNA